jgi:hypothetical protein
MNMEFSVLFVIYLLSFKTLFQLILFLLYISFARNRADFRIGKLSAREELSVRTYIKIYLEDVGMDEWEINSIHAPTPTTSR